MALPRDLRAGLGRVLAHRARRAARRHGLPSRDPSLLPRGGSQGVPDRRRLLDRAGGRRAAGGLAGGAGLRRGRPHVRRRDAGLPARHRAHGPHPAARGSRRRRPLRAQQRVRRRPGASHGGHALPAGRARHRSARRLVPGGCGRRRQGGEAREGADRLRVLESAAHGQLSRLRPRQLDPSRARGARGCGHLPRALRRSRVAAALPRQGGVARARRGPTRRALPARHARARGPLRPARSSATRSTSGATTSRSTTRITRATR